MFEYYKPKKIAKLENCVDTEKFDELIVLINNDTKLLPKQRQLLRLLATRFIQFKYDKLADIYSASDGYMQDWLERLKCVIVDTDSAIANGYIKFENDYNELLKRIIPDEK